MRWLLVLLLLLCLLSPVCNLLGFDRSFLTSADWGFNGVIPLCLLVALAYLRLGRHKIEINEIDLLMFTYFFYVLIHALIVDVRYVYHDRLIAAYNMLLLYVAVRLIGSLNLTHERTFLFVGLVAIGMYQAMLGLLQLYGWQPSLNSLYSITGSFFNPGPYAGYLAVLFPVAVALWCFADQADVRFVAWIKYGAVLMLLLTLLVLPATRSRASWLACVGGTAVVLTYYRPMTDWLRNFAPRMKYRLPMALLVIVLAGASGYGFYQFKKQSAQGRLLMYEISVYTWLDTPVWGAGFNQYAPAFIHHQADYFAQHPDQEKVRGATAGYGEYAFNELLFIGVEEGAVGVLLFLVVLGAVVRSAVLHSRKPGLPVIAGLGGLAALLIFSLFSYPFSVPALQMLFYVFCAVIACATRKPLIRITTIPSSVVGALLTLTCLWTIDQQIKNKRAIDTWHDAMSMIELKAYKRAVQMMSAVAPRLELHGKFMFNYGQALLLTKNYAPGAEAFQIAALHHADSYVFTGLGQCYEALGDDDQAETAYLHARYMMPFLFYPRYLLVKLYTKTGQVVKAQNMARDMLDMPVKVPSPAVDEMKAEAKKTLWRYRN